MGIDLRERLEALSAEATSGPWDNSGTHGQPTDFGVYAPQGRSICSTGGFADGKDITYRQNVANAKFIAAVSNAFRSGDLVTRSEMEEAVAKEREACANALGAGLVTKPALPPISMSEQEKAAFDQGQEAAVEQFKYAIMARSSNKEGE